MNNALRVASAHGGLLEKPPMFDSGITTLNLAISGNPDTFARPGNTVSYIGQSNAGKTVLALTTSAASFYKYGHKPLFYALEPNVMIDIERLFGKRFAKALEVVTDLDLTLEGWQKDVRARFKAAKKSMVVTLDSTDALKCEADIAALDGKSLAKKKATEESDEQKAAKAQRAAAATAWSKCLSEVTKSVGINEGLLILTSQVRTSPGVMFGSPFYRSCGAALDFFSEIRVWMWGSNVEKVEKVNVGGWTKIEVKRNKVTGDARTIYAPIYPSYGIDDTRAMLHFLAETESGAEWANKSSMDKITVGGEIVEGKRVGGTTMTLAEMAAYYEGEGTKDVLKQMVTAAWMSREERLKQEVLAGRKPRFS